MSVQALLGRSMTAAPIRQSHDHPGSSLKGCQQYSNVATEYRKHILRWLSLPSLPSFIGHQTLCQCHSFNILSLFILSNWDGSQNCQDCLHQSGTNPASRSPPTTEQKGCIPLTNVSRRLAQLDESRGQGRSEAPCGLWWAQSGVDPGWCTQENS